MSELKHPNEINRDYIRLLQVMRRFVKEEFSVAIRMTQEDAVEQLLLYADQSRNNVLQEMGKELREFAFGPETPAEAVEESSAEEGVRYYRGAPVVSHGDVSKAPEKETTPAEKPATQKSKPTRVYRGRVVQG